MKPIPTLEELIDGTLARMGITTRPPKQLPFTTLVTGPLFTAIAERDAEIERLKARLQECYSEAESIWHSSDYEADKSFAATIMGASNIAQRNGTTEPEPAKPETFEAHGETWTRHNPGDPMPAVLLRSGGIIENQKASRLKWGVMATNPGQEIIGYRLADEAKPDPYAHLREAEAQGKVIQINIENGNKADWRDLPKPLWKYPPENYRVKPWELPPPPEGKQWHRTDWTEDMLPEGWRPLLKGEKRQKGDEWKDKEDDDWRLCQMYAHLPESTFEFYRTRRPLPQPEVWVDLGPSDILPGSYFKRVDSTQEGWLGASAVYQEGVRLSCPKGGNSQPFYEFSHLREYYQINRSLSTGKWDPNAWEPCRKPAQA